MISLFVETGIQCVDLEDPLDFRDEKANLPHRFHASADGSAVPLAASDSLDDLDTAADDLDSVLTEGDLSVTPLEAMDVFSRRWIPIPYQSTNPFWVRAFFEPTEVQGGVTAYRLVLACDTHSQPENRNDNRRLLRNVEIGMTFKVNPELEPFWADVEVQQMVGAAWQDWARREQFFEDGDEDQVIPYDQNVASAMAKFRALCRYLADQLPEIQILDGGLVSRRGGQVVDAHLILDLGNCRTCGIILETPVDQVPLFAGLEMRSHELPHRLSEGPFESHLQFTRSPLNRLDNGTGDLDRFSGVSLIRLGEEALEASAHAFRGVADAITGMSSPKRYLWDSDLRPVNWTFVPESSTDEDVPIHGHILKFIDPANPFRKPPNQLLAKPASPRYSRKTGLVFMLIEILAQAFAQMNSVAHRSKMPIDGGLRRRRVFRNLVLVHPSGMTPLEQKQLRQGVQRAVDIWYDFYRDPVAFRSGDPQLLPPPPVQPKPAIRLDCDEATAVQLCYLYGEVQSRFQGDAAGFFKCMGKKRQDESTLRVASLDVGGGTTDLVVSQFTTDPDAIGFTKLWHHPLFRDGINLGGDDVVQAVLCQVLFPQIIGQLGIHEKKWQQLFSPTPGAIDPAWERIRRQLVNQLWIPIARYFWSRAEQELPEEHLTLRKIFQETQYPTELIESLNKYLSKLASGQAIDLSTLELRLNVEEFNQTARSVLSKPLYDFCDIVAQFDCDIMLVAGRPAGLPELRRMLIEYCPVPPASLTSLQGHPVEGSWYPFAREGVIEDAKSCVVVGASIHFLATQIGGQFVLDSHGTWPATAIIGVAQPKLKTIPEENVLFKPEGQGRSVSREVAFAGNLWIGCRNIDDNRAYANALYQVKWRPEIERRIRDGKLSSATVKLQFARKASDPFDLTVHSAQGRLTMGRPVNRDHLVLKLQTIYSDDYWLDTGCFYNE